MRDNASPASPRSRSGLAPAALAVPGAGGWLLLGLLAATAYAAFFSGGITIPEESRLQAGVAALVVAAGMGVGAGRIAWPRAPLVWAGAALIALFGAWCALGVEWSMLPGESWPAANRAIAYAAVVALAALAGATMPRAPRLAALGFAGLAVAVALYAMGGKLFPGADLLGVGFGDNDGFSRLRAPIGYWNALGLFLACGTAPLLWVAADPAERPRLRLASLLGLALLVVTIVFTYSRGAIVALVVVCAILAAAGPRPLSRRAWRGLGAGVAVAALVAILAATASDRGLGGTISHRWDEFARVKQSDASDPGRVFTTNASNRWVWWSEALGAFSDKPLTGWGAGSFQASHRLYRQNRLEVRHPHSVPLQLLAETGLVGAVLALGGLALLGAAALAGVRAATGPDRSARVALVALAAAWAVHSLFDWDWDIPALTLPALIALTLAAVGPAASARMSVGRSGAPHPGPAWRRLAMSLSPSPSTMASMAAVAGLALAVSAALPALSVERRVEALEIAERAGGDPAALERAAAKAALAESLDPLSADALFARSTVAARRGRHREAFELLLEAVRRQPDNVRTWRRLLLFQLQTGESRLVGRALREAAALDPSGHDAELTAAIGLLASSPYKSPTATGTPLPRLPRPEAPRRSSPAD